MGGVHGGERGLYFNATIGFAMGLPYEQVLMSPSKRPFRLAGREGTPVKALFG
ncbi:hypothetical protein N9078_01695 [bacterium]|nr:hypothetical protein [bacterium]